MSNGKRAAPIARSPPRRFRSPRVMVVLCLSRPSGKLIPIVLSHPGPVIVADSPLPHSALPPTAHHAGVAGAGQGGAGTDTNHTATTPVPTFPRRIGGCRPLCRSAIGENAPHPWGLPASLVDTATQVVRRRCGARTATLGPAIVSVPDDTLAATECPDTPAGCCRTARRSGRAALRRIRHVCFTRRTAAAAGSHAPRTGPGAVGGSYCRVAGPRPENRGRARSGGVWPSGAER
jgi:hypothetical protein